MGFTYFSSQEVLMRNYRYIVSLLSMFVYIPLAQAKVAAVEWGTFTSLVGSNGVTQHGMYHEDEQLPEFVHGFGELAGQPFFPPDEDCFNFKVPCEFLRNNVITQKMETPVIYFYAGGEVDVTVDVKFPSGMVTETYPGPVSTFPNRFSEPVVGNGHTVFNLKVHGMDRTEELRARLPAVPAGNIYGHARNVKQASVVQTNNELENFLFYRGVGQFTPKLSITSLGGSLALHQCGHCGRIPSAFLVDVLDESHVRLIPLGAMEPADSVGVSAEKIRRLRQHGAGPDLLIMHGMAEARQALLNGVMDAGLMEEEAKAMIDTWEHGYLKTPGLRLLYVLPAEEIDAFLPVTLTPDMPFRRVFVGRIEVMLDTDEQELLRAVLAARDLIDVSRIGRFAEPKLRRLMEVYLASTHMPSKSDIDMLNRLIRRASGLN